MISPGDPVTILDANKPPSHHIYLLRHLLLSVLLTLKRGDGGLAPSLVLLLLGVNNAGGRVTIETTVATATGSTTTAGTILAGGTGSITITGSAVVAGSTGS